jgi:ribonuclease BN (tRNA processing enzyme)
MKTKVFDKKPLALTNDGDLTFFFVGVGSAFTKQHYQTNLLIIKGEDHLLIDCGTRCPHALYELGLNITDIDNFLITHSHADHIGGLEEASLMNRYFTRTKKNMVINEVYQHILWDMSLRGGCAYSEEKAGSVLTFSDFWNVTRPNWLANFPRETLEADVGSINIKMFRTKHIPDSSNSWQNSFWSCGIIVDDRIMFTSDTRFDRELVEWYDDHFNFEIIFHDCQFFTGGVHASLEELNSLPPAIKKKMLLTHYGDNWKQFEHRVKEYGFKDLARQWVFYQF